MFCMTKQVKTPKVKIFESLPSPRLLLASRGDEFVQSASKFFQHAPCELLTRWMRELNPGDSGGAPAVKPWLLPSTTQTLSLFLSLQTSGECPRYLPELFGRLSVSLAVLTTPVIRLKMLKSDSNASTGTCALLGINSPPRGSLQLSAIFFFKPLVVSPPVAATLTESSSKHWAATQGHG